MTVEQLTGTLQRRLTRYLQRGGHLPRRQGDEAAQPEPEEPLPAELAAASIQGRVAMGPERGARVTRLRTASATRDSCVSARLSA